MKNFFYYLKYAGLILSLIAICFIAVFGIRRHMERNQQLAIIASFEEKTRQDSLSTTLHSYTGAVQKVQAYLPGETIGILSIDRLGIKVSVVEGTSKEALRLSAGHFENSALPGRGNFAIAGHSSLVYTCLFNDIHKADVGEEIVLQTQNRTHRYTVTDIFTVDPTDIYVLDPTEDSCITIVTCTNSGANRLILRGSEVKVDVNAG